MTDSKFATNDQPCHGLDNALLSSRGNPQQSCLIDGATSEAAITATEWIGSRSPRIWKLYMAYEQNGLAPEARAYLAHWGKSALWCSRFAKAPQSRGSNTWPRVAPACARSAEDHDRGAAGTQGSVCTDTSCGAAPREAFGGCAPGRCAEEGSRCAGGTERPWMKVEHVATQCPLAAAGALRVRPTCNPIYQAGDRNGSEHAFRKQGGGYNAWKPYDFSVWLGRPRHAAKRRRGGRARPRYNKY